MIGKITTYTDLGPVSFPDTGVSLGVRTPLAYLTPFCESGGTYLENLFWTFLPPTFSGLTESSNA